MRADADFHDFYAANYGRTVALVTSLLGDRNEAEDVAQEAFARALIRWSRLRMYEQPEAWIRRCEMTDEELRDRLGAWARPIEAAPAPDMEVIRRRSRRRIRRVTAAAAACTAALVLAVTVAVPRLTAGPGSPPDSGTLAPGWHPAGPLASPDAGPASAPYLVVLDLQRTGSPAVVYRLSASQPRPRLIATVPLPRPGVTMTGVVGAADDRTFVLVGTSSSGRSPATRYYELRL